MTEPSRAALFFHIDDLDESVKEKIIEAGYLPIKIGSLTNWFRCEVGIHQYLAQRLKLVRE